MVSPRCVTWTPQPDSAGFHHRPDDDAGLGVAGRRTVDRVEAAIEVARTKSSPDWSSPNALRPLTPLPGETIEVLQPPGGPGARPRCVSLV
jgi:hypothetical protein